MQHAVATEIVNARNGNGRNTVLAGFFGLLFAFLNKKALNGLLFAVHFANAFRNVNK
jgi:hypothetical protein